MRSPLALPATWRSPLESIGHHLILFSSYINYSYLACGSLVDISNKILPFLPLCLPLKTSQLSVTCARDSRPCPRPASLQIGYCSHNCHHPSDNPMAGLPCFSFFTCKLYLLDPMYSPISLAPLLVSISDWENWSQHFPPTMASRAALGVLTI